MTPVHQKLMDLHHRLHHLSFPKIFKLSELGYLPKRLVDCKINVDLCVASQFCTANCRPWRTKGKASGSTHTPEKIKPGDDISMDQMFSSQPGLIPHMSGFLTNRRIRGCATFCDHISDFFYVHLMYEFTVE